MELVLWLVCSVVLGENCCILVSMLIFFLLSLIVLIDVIVIGVFCSDFIVFCVVILMCFNFFFCVLVLVLVWLFWVNIGVVFKVLVIVRV